MVPDDDDRIENRFKISFRNLKIMQFHKKK